MTTVLNNKDRNLVKKWRNCFSFFLLVSIFCVQLRQFSNSIFFALGIISNYCNRHRQFVKLIYTLFPPSPLTGNLGCQMIHVHLVIQKCKKG